MLRDVMNYFSFQRSFDQAGYFETEERVQLFKELKHAIRQGGLIALSGIVGCGKTRSLQRFLAELSTEKDIIVSRSLAIDKARLTSGHLITALFCDLSPDSKVKISNQLEQQERKLLELIHKRRKNVVLIVDEAHDLTPKTLVDLKRIIELVCNNNETLSVVLAGHPKLQNSLRQPSLEEIGARTATFTLSGIKGHQQEYIKWLLAECTDEEVILEDLLTEEALVFMVERLITPLQIKYYLESAFQESYRLGCKPVTKDIIETVMAANINDLEPRLIRHGYNAKVIANLLNVRTTEVRSFLQGQLPEGRTQDLRDRMLKVGIPL